MSSTIILIINYSIFTVDAIFTVTEGQKTKKTTKTKQQQQQRKKIQNKKKSIKSNNILITNLKKSKENVSRFSESAEIVN